MKIILDYLEYWLRQFIIFITNYLPVKVIRDDNGVPFLYRYHLFALTNDGPGVCIHHFVKSDERGQFHNHPWNKSLSFILCGGYQEEILTSSFLKSPHSKENKERFYTVNRPRFSFNYLDGIETYHRVMIPDGGDAWTLFFFQKRSKTWGMYNLQGEYKAMSTQISDADGGWWNHVMKGLGVHSHLEQKGKVIATVDIIIIGKEQKNLESNLEGNIEQNTEKNIEKVLLIKRGKNPYKGYWAFPGGRIEQKDADILAAAQRELKEETKLTDIPLQYIKTIGNNTRDNRGFCLTNIFLSRLGKIPSGIKAGDDAVDYNWFPLSDLPEMAFDHREILEDIKKNL